jgi:hypothetical protein
MIAANESIPQADDLYLVDPCEIDLSGHGSREATGAEVMAMAISLHQHGQRRAVECRKVDGDKIQLVHGFVRVAAARLIRAGFRYNDPVSGEERMVKENQFKVWAVLSGEKPTPLRAEPRRCSTPPACPGQLAPPLRRKVAASAP